MNNDKNETIAETTDEEKKITEESTQEINGLSENTGAAEPETKKEKKSTFLDDVTDVIETVLICMLVFLMIRAYVVDQAIVDGTSMEPTLYNTERIIYNQLYTPKNYDIVIVENEKLGPLVKRVIATEGEELDIRDGYVYVNGIRLDEQIYNEGENLTAEHFVTSLTSVNYNPFIKEEDYPITIPPGCIFVMGDNRCVSNDSRSNDVGFVSKSDVIGKVIMRYSPLKKFKWFW